MKTPFFYVSPAAEPVPAGIERTLECSDEGHRHRHGTI